MLHGSIAETTKNEGRGEQCGTGSNGPAHHMRVWIWRPPGHPRELFFSAQTLQLVAIGLAA
jgi:hypothetical protein